MKVTALTPDMIGRKARFKIYDLDLEGKIQFESGKYYLCQDTKDGNRCGERFGYKYSWSVIDGSSYQLGNNNVSEVELIGETVNQYQIY